MLLDELHQQKEDCQQAIERMNKLQRLQTNPDFEELILEGFCEKECARYARLSGDPEIPESVRLASGNACKASGVLMRYIQTILMKGQLAEQEIKEVEEAINNELMKTGDEE